MSRVLDKAAWTGFNAAMLLRQLVCERHFANISFFTTCIFVWRARFVHKLALACLLGPPTAPKEKHVI
jgi:hypothetical protein